MAKFLSLVSGIATEVVGLVTSAGSADASKLIQTDSNGRIDNSLMPAGVGAADTNNVVASEALAAGDAVNVWNNAGTTSARKADASTTGKSAHGFVLAAVSSGANATVYAEATNTQATGLVGGDVWLSATTPGKPTQTPPNVAGGIQQKIGYAVSATAYNFQQGAVFGTAG